MGYDNYLTSDEELKKISIRKDEVNTKILNMVKENYYSNNNSGEFRKTDYPEVNSKFYVNPNQDFKMTSAKNDTVSNQFACFLQEFLLYINSKTLQNLDGENKEETAQETSCFTMFFGQC